MRASRVAVSGQMFAGSTSSSAAYGFTTQATSATRHVTTSGASGAAGGRLGPRGAPRSRVSGRSSSAASTHHRDGAADRRPAAPVERRRRRAAAAAPSPERRRSARARARRAPPSANGIDGDDDAAERRASAARAGAARARRRRRSVSSAGSSSASTSSRTAQAGSTLRATDRSRDGAAPTRGPVSSARHARAARRGRTRPSRSADTGASGGRGRLAARGQAHRRQAVLVQHPLPGRRPRPGEPRELRAGERDAGVELRLLAQRERDGALQAHRRQPRRRWTTARRAAGPRPGRRGPRARCTASTGRPSTRARSRIPPWPPVSPLTDAKVTLRDGPRRRDHAGELDHARRSPRAGRPRRGRTRHARRPPRAARAARFPAAAPAP